MYLYSPYQLGTINLKNRLVMPPMCMYSAESDGKATDFHYTHYETRAIGGVGLIIVEATGVTTNGRISEKDLGLWNDEQRDFLVPLVDKVKKQGAHIGIQLAHSGRKHVGENETPVGPSPIPFDEQSRTPHELTIDEIQLIIQSFRDATVRADSAGFDVIEIHAAHGYLIHQFLSPITNQRTDNYGGSFENRIRLLHEILTQVRSVLSSQKPIILRISAMDYRDDGLSVNDFVRIINRIKTDIEMVHVSSGGLIPVPMKVFPGYQLQLCEQIKHECQIPTIAVGLITSIEMIEEVLGNQRADLVALGRELLRNPYFALQNGKKYKQTIPYPHPYERAFL